MKQTLRKGILAAAFLAAFLCGCCGVPGEQPPEAAGAGLTKAQEVRVLDLDGSIRQVLTTQEELDTFLDDLMGPLLVDDQWELARLPSDAQPLGRFSLRQTETLKWGQRPEDREMEELGELTVYAGVPCLTLHTAGMEATFSLPRRTAEALWAYFA